MTTFDELWGRHTPNSWARVPRGPVAAFVGAALFGTTGFMATTAIAGVSLATMTGFLVTTAVASWAMSALMPKMDSQRSASASLQNMKQAVGDFDIVYGEVRKGGTITFMETSDRVGWKVFEDDYLHFIVVLAGHEVESIGDIYFNDEIVTLDANGFATGERWKSLARVKKYTGSPDQIADPDLVAETSVDSNFRGRGIAYLYIRLDWDAEVFANGTPTVTAVVKGKKVWDPRTNTTKWTDNAALCIRDYVANDYGVNAAQSPTTLQSTSWATMANVCDTLITKKNGTTEKRYTLNGILTTARSPKANLEDMLTTCGGTLYWGEGLWQLKVGYLPDGPYVSLDMDDLRSEIGLVTKNSRKENFNSIVGTFIDKDQDYIEAEYPRLKSATFLARDNGQDNPLDMTLPLTTSASMAQRLAKMALFRSREEMVLSAEFSLKAMQLSVGDVVQFSFPRYGFVNKLFEVITWSIVPNAGELKVALTLKETSAAAYDWNAEENDIIKNNTRLPNPTAGLAITGLVVTNRNTVQKDGTLIGEVVLSWDGARSAFVDNYEVQWKRNTDTKWSSTSTSEVEIVLPSVVYGVPYNFRVRAISAAGFIGAWTQIGATLDGKNTPPGLPTNVTATGIMKAIEVKWTKPADTDFNHVEIWGNTTNSTTGATLVAKSSGTTYIDNMDGNIIRWYFLKSVDHSNNKSAFTAGKSATSKFVGNNDVKDVDVKQLLEDKGLASVEILAAAPTTGNFEGRTYYNTADGKLYIYKSGAWAPAVDVNFGDAILSKDNFPTDLKPVEILSALPTTGNFKGRMVFLTTDNKLYRHLGSPTGSAGFTSAVAATDLTGLLTATNLADGAVNEDKLGNNAVVARTIQAGAVGVNALAARSVVASKLQVSDFTNLVSDDQLQDLNAWGGNAKDANVTLDPNYGATVAAAQTKGAFLVYAKSPLTEVTSITSLPIPVSPDDEFLVEGIIAATGAHKSRLFGQFLDSENGTSVGVFSTAWKTSTAFEKLEASGKTPSNARWVRFVFQVDASSYVASGGHVAFTFPTLRRKNAGKLIVDGAIGANHLTTNSVTTGKLAAGAVVADKIAAGAIVASKMAISDWTNLVTDDQIQDEDAWNGDAVPHVNINKTYGNTTPAAKSKGTWIVTRSATPTVETNITSAWIPCNPTDQFYVEGTIGATSGPIKARVWGQFADINFAGVGSFTSVVKTTATFETLEANSQKAPATARYVRYIFSVEASGYTASGGHIVFGNPVLRRKNGGKLIVDGEIGANHLDVNSVRAGIITAGVINASNLFVDNVITAAKLNTDSLSVAGISIFGGDIRSNNYDFAAGTGWALNINGALVVPHATITTAKIANLAVDTIKIANRAVTLPAFVSASSNDFAMNYVLTGPPGETYEVFIMASMTISFGGTLVLKVNGTDRWTETPASGTLAAKGWVVNLGPGTHTIRLAHTNTGNTNGGSLYVLATKR